MAIREYLKTVMQGVKTYVDNGLAGKADSSHGTHVTWSTTTPKANGTASVGSETKVARGDHIHPTDTTRAAASDLTSHTGNKSNPHGVTKAQVGLGNVENKSSATIRGELTKANVTTALGYTPPTTNTTYNDATTSQSGLMSATDKSKLDAIDLDNLGGVTSWNDLTDKPFGEIGNILVEQHIESSFVPDSDICPHTSTESGDYDSLFEVGKEYFLKLNGQEYLVEYRYDDLDESYGFGSQYRDFLDALPTGEGLPYPFFIANYGSYLSILTTEAVSGNFKIYTKDGIKYLDSKYIKDMYYEYETEPVETTLIDQTYEGFEDWDSGFGLAIDGDKLELVIGQTYTVIWDGETYQDLECYDDDGYPTVGAPYRNYSTYPFGVYTVIGEDGYGFQTSSTESSHTVKITTIKTLKGIKYIDPKYIKDMYYETEPVETVVFEGQDVEFGTSSNVNIYMTEDLIIGQKYTVNFDGELYEDLECYDDDGIILGDLYNYPFKLRSYEDEGRTQIYRINTDQTSHFIEVIHVVDKKIVKIDTKYLPEALQFGETSAEVTLVDKTCEGFEPSGDLFWYEVESQNVLVLGQTYTVVWDGTTYDNLVCFDDDGDIALGSPYGDYSEYPFNIYTYIDDGVWLSMNTGENATSHTVKVTMQPTIKPIDTKYLPEHLQFGERETGGDTLTWDGNTDGLVSVADMLYKVSNATPTIDDFANGAELIMHDTVEQIEDVLPITSEDVFEAVNGIIMMGEMCIIVHEEGVGVDVDGIAFNEVGIYLINTEGYYTKSLTINGYTGFPMVKPIDPKYLPDNIGGSQSDWSVNDEIDSAYVHNRPMYIEDPVEKELFNGSYSPMGQISDTVYVALLNISFEYTFHNGQVCIINFNGTTYEVVGQEDEFGVGFGNKSLTNELDGTSFEDTGEPFLFFADDGMLGMYYTGATTGTMAIAAIDTPVVIEEKYVPFLQSDWDENDIASASYIKNRPFYIDYSGYSYVSDSTRFTANVINDTTTYYIASISTGHDIEKCKNITLILDGTEYNAMPNVFGGYGSSYILAKFYGMSEEEMAVYGVVDSGEPYCLYKDGETSVLLITSLTGSTHSVNLSFDAPDYSKIDENYLPSYSLSSSGGTIRLNSDSRGIISEVNISNATTSQAGLMSSSDKSKLNSIPSDVQTQLNNKATSSHTHPYVSDMTVSGSTLTYNKGDGTTGTVTLPAGGGSSGGVGQNVEGIVYTINGASVTAKVGAEVFNDYTNNKAIGQYSHAEGYNTLARGDYSHTEGGSTQTTASYSHAEGDNAKANGYAAHAEGQNTTASGYASHAEGFGAKATGTFSHAEGYHTVAAGSYQHAEGMYNIQSSDYAHIVGNGTADNARSNAHTLDWDGNAWFKGDVYVGGSDKTTGKQLATKEYVDSVAGTGGGSGGTGGGSGVTYTLSKSGSNITLTGSDGSTSSVQDSDTNTTYSQGTDSRLGLTKLYTSSGTNTDGAMTQAATTSYIDDSLEVVCASMPAGKPYTWNLSDMTGVINMDGMLMKQISTTAYGTALNGKGIVVTFASGEQVAGVLVPAMGDGYLLILMTEELGETCIVFSVDSTYAAMAGVPISGTLLCVPQEMSSTIKSVTISAGADEDYFIYVNSGEGSDTLTWDGDTTGKTEFDGVYKVSDYTFTIADCANGGTIIAVAEDGTEQTITFTSENIMTEGDAVIISADVAIISIGSGVAASLGLEIGTYFSHSTTDAGTTYVKSLTINGYTFSEKELKLDPKYLSILNEVEGESISLGDTLTWDGNTSGLTSLGNAYLVSSDIGCIELASNYSEGEIPVRVEYYDVVAGTQSSVDGTISNVMGSVWVLNAPSQSIDLDTTIIITTEDNVSLGPAGVIPKKGIYFASNDQVCIVSLTIDGYDFKEYGDSHYEINPEYLPEHLQFGGTSGASNTLDFLTAEPNFTIVEGVMGANFFLLPNIEVTDDLNLLNNLTGIYSVIDCVVDGEHIAFSSNPIGTNTQVKNSSELSENELMITFFDTGVSGIYVTLSQKSFYIVMKDLAVGESNMAPNKAIKKGVYAFDAFTPLLGTSNVTTNELHAPNPIFGGGIKYIPNKYLEILEKSSGGSDTFPSEEKYTIKQEYIPTLEHDSIIIKSSTEGSSKKFKITVDDSGTLTATEIV